ncbi:lectin subunit alpha-like [Calliphora vicina]|uniref:lectin subunit alpha-like n=1 Tax=Calliphora vicina TaxID=7373 RepID=UPI00325AE9A6
MSPTFYLYLTLVFLLLFKVNQISSYGRMYTADSTNKYYIENDQKYTWIEALAKCRKMNMSLLTIDTVTKSNEINQLVQHIFSKKVTLWVGGFRMRHPTHHFVWVETGKPFTYTYWEGKNPDFKGQNEYCIDIGWGNKMEWNDDSCNFETGFVCEPNHQLLENERLQQQFHQEVDKQQKLHTQVLETEKREKMLLQELESVKNDVKQKEEFWNQRTTLQLEEMKNKKYGDINFHFHQDRCN